MRTRDTIFIVLLVFSLAYGCWRINHIHHPKRVPIVLDAAALMILVAAGLMIYIGIWNGAN